MTGDDDARVVRYLGRHRLEVAGQPTGAPGPGQVQLDVAYTGVCGTDLHAFEGHLDARIRPPGILGHEMVGHVHRLGDGVSGLNPGELVTVRPILSCGSCRACRSGWDHICRDLQVLGLDAPGSMRRRWNVPAGVVVPLPDRLALVDAALVEPTTVAVHVVKRSGLVPGDRAVVVGAGPIGVLVALVARRHRAEVLVAEPNPRRRAAAAELGLDVAEPSNGSGSGSVEDVAREWSGGEGATVSFEVSGSAAGADTATAVLGPRGRLCMVAIHAEPRPMDLYQFFLRELSLVGARLYDRDDFDTASALLVSGAIPVGSLVSEVVSMEDVPRAFEVLADQGAMKILVDCGGA